MTSEWWTSGPIVLPLSSGLRLYYMSRHLNKLLLSLAACGLETVVM